MVETKIFTAKTMHKRFTPKVNKFVYGVYYLALPLSKLENLKLLPPLISFNQKKHGLRDGSDLRGWIDKLLEQQNITEIDEIMLVTMPRILGYVFNPVSFWLCLDNGGKLKAVLAEVNNTFGETHSYLCHNNGGEITEHDLFAGEKLFHVSPFLEREGKYQFKFNYSSEKLAIWIDYYKNDEKILATNLVGKFSSASKGNLLKSFLKHPLVTFKVITLIHYQALKLVMKGIKYISKPKQRDDKFSKVNKI